MPSRDNYFWSSCHKTSKVTNRIRDYFNVNSGLLISTAFIIIIYYCIIDVYNLLNNKNIHFVRNVLYIWYYIMPSHK